ncbi:hypothetical protein GCM10028826_41050 [Mucilaginibacter boryungensis]
MVPADIHAQYAIAGGKICVHEYRLKSNLIIDFKKTDMLIKSTADMSNSIAKIITIPGYHPPIK